MRDVSFETKGFQFVSETDKESPGNRSCMESHPEADGYMKSHCENMGYIKGCSENERVVWIYSDAEESL